MTKKIFTGTCTAMSFAATVALMAQTPAPPPGNASSTEGKVTVTGCLKAAPAGPTDAAAATAGGATQPGTAGTTGAAGAAGAASEASDAKFVLADATIGKPAADAGSTASAAGAPATSAEPTAKGQTQTYRLVANPAALSPHVGKKLELTGTLVNESASAASSQASPGASGPVLRVEAGKVLAASCQD